MPLSINPETEKAIFRLLAEGKSESEVARILKIREKSVEVVLQLGHGDYGQVIDCRSMTIAMNSFESDAQYNLYVRAKKAFTIHSDEENVKAREEGFMSVAEYRDYHARESGFESFDALLRTFVIEEGAGLGYEVEMIIIQTKGFSSMRKYRNHLARRQGFASAKALARQRKWLSEGDQEGMAQSAVNLDSILRREKAPADFSDEKSYLDYLARTAGFESRSAYRAYQAEQRRQCWINQFFSSYLRDRLEGLGKDESWLAGMLNISKGTVSKWANGWTLPRRKLEPTLFEALEAPYKSIDELASAA